MQVQSRMHLTISYLALQSVTCTEPFSHSNFVHFVVSCLFLVLSRVNALCMFASVPASRRNDSCVWEMCVIFLFFVRSALGTRASQPAAIFASSSVRLFFLSQVFLVEKFSLKFACDTHEAILLHQLHSDNVCASRMIHRFRSLSAPSTRPFHVAAYVLPATAIHSRQLIRGASQYFTAIIWMLFAAILFCARFPMHALAHNGKLPVPSAKWRSVSYIRFFSSLNFQMQ